MQPASKGSSRASSSVFITSSFPRRIAESIAEALFDVLPGGGVVLRPALCNFHGTHDGAQPAGARPVPGARDTVEQSGTVGVAASGRVDDRVSLNARDLVALTF